MTQLIALRGIAWDHPRGYEPLRATSAAFALKHPCIQIDWDIRSLKDFGDRPLEDLIATYDLITIDHPYMGQAYENRLLLPLDKNLPKNMLDLLTEQSVVRSFHTYSYNHHLYALPIDAAALVAASRDDLIGMLRLRLPKNRADLYDFYKKIPSDYKLAWPLCKTDLWCTFLTLCAQNAGRDFNQKSTFDETTGRVILDELKYHLEYLHPDSINWNPIQVLDHMGSNDEIVYVPFLFGYTNYARVGYAEKLIKFSNSPTNPKTDVSTILGGVGLAISTQSKHVDLALSYVTYVANAKTQVGIYTENGGQPGNLIAWQSEVNNKLCNNFFNDTMETMQKAYIRPQHNGWNQFQEQAAELLHCGIVKDTASNIIMKDLNQLYKSIM